MRSFIGTAPAPAQLRSSLAAVNASVKGALASAVALVEQRQLPVLDVVIPALQAATDAWSISNSLFASMNSTLEGLKALIAQLPATECDATAAAAHRSEVYFCMQRASVSPSPNFEDLTPRLFCRPADKQNNTAVTNLVPVASRLAFLLDNSSYTGWPSLLKNLNITLSTIDAYRTSNPFAGGRLSIRALFDALGQSHRW